MTILDKNIKTLQLEPCANCGGHDVGKWNYHIGKCITDDCNDHIGNYTKRTLATTSHFKIQGNWYTFKSEQKMDVISLVEIEEGAFISGRIHWPEQTDIRTLTDLLVNLRRWGVPEQALNDQLSPGTVSRMRGRVFKTLVHGK